MEFDNDFLVNSFCIISHFSMICGPATFEKALSETQLYHQLSSPDSRLLLFDIIGYIVGIFCNGVDCHLKLYTAPARLELIPSTLMIDESH